ncbi:MAG: hypothetical protein IKM55_00895 [Bacilli bacterium]|nr:hypothetical protein [Bacilli bacterium]
MTQKETNLRSVLFLVIGILLLLSLIICIYIVSAESDLIKISAEVVEVDTKRTSTGKVKLVVNYDVNGQPYKYDNYMYKGEIQVGDKVSLYYHEKQPASVQPFKTNKLIFIFPVIGLALCILGLFELFKKNDDDDDVEFETAVIGVVGNTQQLKIVTDDTDVAKYEPTPEEVVEAPVKTVVKEEVVEEPAPVVEEQPVVENVSTPEPEPVPEPVAPKVEPAPVVETAVASSIKNPDPEPTPVAVVAAPTPVIEKSPAVSKMEEAIVQKVKNETNGASLNEDEIKKVIKDVLKEVIAEVKDEKEPAKPVVQKRVIPNNYYISGTSLIYEEAGKDSQEIELKTVKSIVRTVNSAGNVVKLVVSNEAVKCVLTNMKNIDLEQLASLLNNKMRTIDDSFTEEIEYKEY